ncbi:enoyl-CoA hydratase/isomerase family protein [Reinekea marina]|uniref:Enoyl-CoA hydratase/isomerase family protein n=1 Tax=Reinekea marina TaxID=1310421 RepID=A0ABV7WNT9_9GAMM|nr:enoyl-CoA hydratase/isomerase family protein [Reinekea marina]MDN3649461.1 enoyl-CoA hydratase/isomerase family protein [Reinekea marina]
MKETIVIERPMDGVAKIIFNRPEIGNAYDHEFVCTLITALDEISLDSNVKILWLTANGPHFCSGPDSRWLQHRQESGRAEHQLDAEHLSRLFHTLYDLPIPVIATVRGKANADAIGILCCCDIVFASEKSSFTLNEVHLGLAPVLQSPYLIRTLGEHAARYYALTGETLDAYTATRLGLVNKLMPEQELDSYADMIIRNMVRLDETVLIQTKSMLTVSSIEPLDESLLDTLIESSIDVRESALKQTKFEHSH